MEEVCGRDNCLQALKQVRVRANKGSAGVDGMTVTQLPGFLKQDWPAIREQLLKGAYQAVRAPGAGNHTTEPGCKPGADSPRT